MSKSPSYIGLLNITLSLEGSEMELKVVGPMFSFPVDADAIGGALADGLRGIFHCKPKAESERKPLDGTSEAADAERFRWLCEDPSNSNDRTEQNRILASMRDWSLSTARARIDMSMHGWRAAEPGK